MQPFLSLPPAHQFTRHWWVRTLSINAAIAIAVFGLIQLVPAGRDNPPALREPAWDSPETRELAVEACFDCHSNATVWPWYARVAPISWVLGYDVTEGREALNFSEWDRHAASETVDPDDPFPPKTLSERIEDEIRNGTMPPGTYQLMHPAARLSEAEKEALIAGLIATVKQSQDARPAE